MGAEHWSYPHTSTTASHASRCVLVHKQAAQETQGSDTRPEDMHAGKLVEHPTTDCNLEPQLQSCNSTVQPERLQPPHAHSVTWGIHKHTLHTQAQPQLLQHCHCCCLVLHEARHSATRSLSAQMQAIASRSQQGPNNAQHHQPTKSCDDACRTGTTNPLGALPT
jgi:hypothetical protein